MGVGVWKKIKNAFVKAGNWIHNKILKPVGRTVVKVAKKVVAPIISARGKVLKTAGDVLGSVVPGQLGQFAQTAGNLWGKAGEIADNFKNS